MKPHLLQILFFPPVNAFHQPALHISRDFSPFRSTQLFSAEESNAVEDSSTLPSNKDCKPRKLKDPYYFQKQETNKPASAFILGGKNFIKQSRGIAEQLLADVGIVGEDYIPPEERPPLCLGFTLSNEAVKEAEVRREARDGGRVDVNPVAGFLYDVGCFALDELFDGKPISRFWFLETIARIPYFSYVSMLHLYESFGWWRGIELRKIHNAEEYNELHHLLIMEALGGNRVWSDRFLGYHVAIAYYWALCALFFVSPAAAYQFMELLESHAVDTYGTFLKENKDRLKSLPAPKVAVSYYKNDDMYWFDDFQVSKKAGQRRPPCDNLYDVFKNISEDEAEHVKTMIACQDYAKVGTLVVSPHLSSSKETEEVKQLKRENWKEWADSINEMDSYESSSPINNFE